MENYLENIYGDEFEVTDNIENYWDYRSNDDENLEEKYYFPIKAFLTPRAGHHQHNNSLLCIINN